MFFFGSHSWRGKSGQRYRFRCVLSKKGLPPAGVGGIYVFVRRRWAFLLEPLYVGKAHDIRNRLLGHEKWGRAFWYYGATERYILHPIPDEIDRRRIEEDLIKGLKPRMNDAALGQAEAKTMARRNGQTRRWFDFRGAADAKPQRSAARA
ncbi:MAG: GIY-YIG nuclease family protein [Hyphomonadaceae bacterium]|nr:GIY-YIG nuclease family protein [Hyphomonadaceae bacterium]